MLRSLRRTTVFLADATDGLEASPCRGLVGLTSEHMHTRSGAALHAKS